MTRIVRTLLALCLTLALAGWLRQAKARLEGAPSRPTFVFDTTFVLANFTVLHWTGEKWAKVWGIASNHSNRESIRRVEYGVVPKGYFEYVPLRYPLLATKTLYKFDFEGGAIRGGGMFIVLDRSGTQAIVIVDDSRPFADVLAEFEKMKAPASEGPRPMKLKALP